MIVNIIVSITRSCCVVQRTQLSRREGPLSLNLARPGGPLTPTVGLALHTKLLSHFLQRGFLLLDPRFHVADRPFTLFLPPHFILHIYTHAQKSVHYNIALLNHCCYVRANVSSLWWCIDLELIGYL